MGDAQRHGWLLPQSGPGWSRITVDRIHSFHMGFSLVRLQDARRVLHANHCWEAASAKGCTWISWEDSGIYSILVWLSFVILQWEKIRWFSSVVLVEGRSQNPTPCFIRATLKNQTQMYLLIFKHTLQQWELSSRLHTLPLLTLAHFSVI